MRPTIAAAIDAARRLLGPDAADWEAATSGYLWQSFASARHVPADGDRIELYRALPIDPRARDAIAPPRDRRQRGKTLARSVSAVAARLGGLGAALAQVRERRAGDVAVDARHQVVVEDRSRRDHVRDPSGARLQVVVVVPARIVEAARHHRRAQQVAHLAVRHARS